MEKDSVLLTMGMPVYNEEKYIGEAIESLLVQTYKDFILIISDNGSTDRTSEICKYYAEKDKRIIYVRHKTNKGAFFNFKYPLDRANTPFFMFCSGHDKWHPQFVEKLLPIIQKEKLIAVYPQAREIKIDETLGESHESDYSTIEIEKPSDRYKYVLKRMGWCNCIIIHGIWNKEILKKCYVKQPIIGSDVLTILKATFFGKFKQSDDTLFFFRTIRIEKNRRSREFNYATGKKTQRAISNFKLKKNFIRESIKILHEKELKLNSFSRLNLSIITTYVFIKRFYIKDFFTGLLKKILPSEKYLSLERKFKNRVGRFL